MKKYRLKKDIIGAKKGMEFELSEPHIFEEDWAGNVVNYLYNIYIEELSKINDLIQLIGIDNEEYFEEITTAPVKFKVGDYVVCGKGDYIEYIKINEISIYNNGDIRYDTNKAEDLRKPTQEELDLYFR